MLIYVYHQYLDHLHKEDVNVLYHLLIDYVDVETKFKNIQQMGYISLI